MTQKQGSRPGKGYVTLGNGCHVSMQEECKPFAPSRVHSGC
ncbi:hypothetical protein U0070_024435 [Myodes glareolus]|uniref:Uncharacterized protein n=1 Tax=Myodes glareolus TaxID=447135 RepID=A0AAW0ICV6_MYOGA